jgi:hypothetical protein
MRKFTRRWVPHDLSAIDKAKPAIDVRMLLHALRNNQNQNFWHIMTREES